jgi:hypothetical protein
MTKRRTESPPQGNIKQALLDAREDAILSSRTEDGPARKKESRGLRVLLLLTIAFGLYALGTKPSWLVTPPAEPEARHTSEASLRVAMWQQSLYVDRFEADHGRLPRSLEAAGAPLLEGITYQTDGAGGYLLQGQIGGTGLLMLEQDDSKEAFLGESLVIIANRGSE